jgi:hypothetical protein
MSGDALTRTQFFESALTATDDCVRHLALIDPFRTPRQLWQLQFHCGKPPPAAAPRTRTLIKRFPNTSGGQHEACESSNARKKTAQRQKASVKEGEAAHTLGSGSRNQFLLTAPDVHRNFEAETQFNKGWFAPSHWLLLTKDLLPYNEQRRMATIVLSRQSAVNVRRSW